MLVFLDVECYIDYFLIVFKNEKGVINSFELHDTSDLNRELILRIMNETTTLGFNSINYDLPMIVGALKGFNNRQLKDLSNLIINSNNKFEVLKQLGIVVPRRWDHIDVIANLPGRKEKLKLLAAQIGFHTIQDLPIPHDSFVNVKQREILKKYCINDVDILIEVYNRVKSDIEIKKNLSAKYKLDLRSKSRPKVATAIMKKLFNLPSSSNIIDTSKIYKYKAPSYLKFESEHLQALLTHLEDCDYVVNAKGKLDVKVDSAVEEEQTNEDERFINVVKRNIDITFNDVKYAIGLGGMHTKEKKRSIIADDSHFILDVDVVSYYPAIIINNSIYPESIGYKFIDMIKMFRDGKIEATRIGDIKNAASLKMVINALFGNYMYIYSNSYSPQSFIHVTLTGQLSLMMLTEMIGRIADVKVASANTDGLVIYGLKTQYEAVLDVLKQWESLTDLTLEHTNYKALYNESVNSYIAVKQCGNIKGKGTFAAAGFYKNPQCEIIAQAVRDFIKYGTSIEETINSNNDVRNFLAVSRVNNGGYWRFTWLGSVVRWYYSYDEEDCIRNCESNNKVANSDYAVPMMTLVDRMPDDLNRGLYIAKAYKLLEKIGVDIGV